VLLWLVVAVLLLLAWVTVTGRLGRSRHGYAAVTPRPSGPSGLENTSLTHLVRISDTRH
jgi:hypothetical protein